MIKNIKVHNWKRKERIWVNHGILIEIGTRIKRFGKPGTIVGFAEYKNQWLVVFDHDQDVKIEVDPGFKVEILDEEKDFSLIEDE